MVASHVPPTGDLACNPGMCPNWELNWQAITQSTEPRPAKAKSNFLKLRTQKIKIIAKMRSFECDVVSFENLIINWTLLKGQD